ncbi:MAG: peptide ABC transporter substrate-binding protein [Campylobacterales bacterium]|nr:peptide ABC transporter substrate-binding protein [Campylobacterales bacterium]
MKQLLLLWLVCLSLSASTLHLNASSNPSRLNPLLATDAGSSEIAAFIFNALVKYDKEGKEIIGDLAETYAFKDERTLIFKLRKNVKWHDGHAFSAEDVLFTFELIHSPKVVTPYTSTFRMVESVKILDHYTIEVVYKKPYFKALETWMMQIVPKHILENEENIMGSSFNTKPVGTGPYRLSKLEFSKNIELDAFDAYFEHRPYIDRIIFHVVADPTTRFLMLKSHQIDVGSLEPMQLQRQVDEKFYDYYQKIEQISHSYTYLGLNLKSEKFKDPRVREALSLGIDRQELVDILFLGHAEVCTGPFLPGGAAFNEKVKAPQRDVEKAKRLLLEAGYSKEKPFEFEIATSNASEVRPYAAEIMQHQLANIGVKVHLRVMEWQAFLNTVVFARKFDAVLLGWSLSLSPDPYLVWHSDNDKPGGFNFIGYRNEKVDALIKKAEGIINREKLAEVQKKIFKELVDDNAYLFLFIPSSISVINKKISPIEPAVNGFWHNQIEWTIAP